MSWQGMLRRMGISSNGNDVEIFRGRLYAQNINVPKGKIWYVDPNRSSSGNGKSWANAFTTMEEAFAAIASGDRVFFVGKLKEQLITPVQVFDVSIIGAGNRPRHADSTPDGGQDAAATWAAPAVPTAATPLVKVLQQGWRFANMVMAGPADASCILGFRNGGADDAERDASHLECLGVRFASGQNGFEQSGGLYNVGIFDCTFHDLTGYAIKHTAGAGIAAPFRWQILRNRFGSCANLMGVWAAHQFQFCDNDIKEITTNYLDFRTGSANTVLRNSFDVAAADFDPTGKVGGSATDNWSNYLLDAIETGIPAD